MTPTPENPLAVSVVITNHNYAAFVGDAIESALSQTHPAVEVIVVDDGSSDGSASVLRRYRAAGVKVLLQDNRGQAGALNSGFKLSAGRLVIFLDADDRLLPGAAAAAAASFESGASVVQWPLALTDVHGAETGEIDPAAELAHGDLLPQLVSQGPLQWASSGLGAAWARAYLDAVMPIPEAAFRIGSDAYLVALAPLYGHLVALEQPLTLYRRHGRNHSGAGFDELVRFDVEIARELFGVAASHARALGVPVSPARWERRNWSIALAQALEELDAVVGRDAPFVLIDGMELSLEPSSGRQVIPFLERDGEYWGLPEDDDHALRELERLRRAGARFLVWAWPAFWWREGYPQFIERIRRVYPSRLENERLQIFDLS